MCLRFLPILLVMATIFILSHVPGSALPPAVNGLDKLLHAVAYGSLAASCLYCLKPAMKNKKNLRIGFGIIFFCFLFGLSDEYHQFFVAGRSSSWLDLAADTTGASLAVFIRHWWRTRPIKG